jgi:ribosomal protein S18 acetylase RimI-like enzyme
MGMWVPRTGEYIVAEPWRHREEIANIVEVTARKGKVGLIRALVDRLTAFEQRLVLVGDDPWRDQPQLYLQLGFERVETIVFFEKNLRRFGQGPEGALDLPQLDYVPLDASGIDLLIELDHSSFPWLWWNSALELGYYMGLPGVYVYAAEKDGEPVGYASFTMYQGWAHLDRLAVVNAQQGRRFGAAQLLYTLQRMREMGANTVGLSTQSDNTQSHRLYSGFGFTRTQETMHFHGFKLDPTLGDL